MWFPNPSPEFADGPRRSWKLQDLIACPADVLRDVRGEPKHWRVKLNCQKIHQHTRESNEFMSMIIAPLLKNAQRLQLLSADPLGAGVGGSVSCDGSARGRADVRRAVSCMINSGGM